MQRQSMSDIEEMSDDRQELCQKLLLWHSHSMAQQAEAVAEAFGWLRLQWEPGSGWSAAVKERIFHPRGNGIFDITVLHLAAAIKASASCTLPLPQTLGSSSSLPEVSHTPADDYPSLFQWFLSLDPHTIDWADPIADKDPASCLPALCTALSRLMATISGPFHGVPGETVITGATPVYDFWAAQELGVSSEICHALLVFVERMMSTPADRNSRLKIGSAVVELAAGILKYVLRMADAESHRLQLDGELETLTRMATLFTRAPCSLPTARGHSALDDSTGAIAHQFDFAWRIMLQKLKSVKKRMSALQAEHTAGQSHNSAENAKQSLINMFQSVRLDDPSDRKHPPSQEDDVEWAPHIQHSIAALNTALETSLVDTVLHKYPGKAVSSLFFRLQVYSDKKRSTGWVRAWLMMLRIHTVFRSMSPGELGDSDPREAGTPPLQAFAPDERGRVAQFIAELRAKLPRRACFQEDQLCLHTILPGLRQRFLPETVSQAGKGGDACGTAPARLVRLQDLSLDEEIRVLEQKPGELSGGTGIVVISATLTQRWGRLSKLKTAQCWQLQARPAGAALKLVGKKYPMTAVLRASNMQCAHTEAFTLAHMLHESQSTDLASTEVIRLPVPAERLVDHGDNKCHTVRLLGMEAGMLPQFYYDSTAVEEALLKCADMHRQLTERVASVWLFMEHLPGGSLSDLIIRALHFETNYDLMPRAEGGQMAEMHAQRDAEALCKHAQTSLQKLTGALSLNNTNTLMDQSYTCQLSGILGALKQRGPGVGLKLSPQDCAMYIFRLSWQRRLTMMRDIALAVAQCHEGRLAPGGGSGDSKQQPKKKHAFCLHDVRLHNIMLDSFLRSVVLIDSANGCIKGTSCNGSAAPAMLSSTRQCKSAIYTRYIFGAPELQPPVECDPHSGASPEGQIGAVHSNVKTEHPAGSMHAQPDGPASGAASSSAGKISSAQHASTREPPPADAFESHAAMDVWMLGLVFHEIVTLSLLGEREWIEFGSYCRVSGLPVERLNERLRNEWENLMPPLFRSGTGASATGQSMLSDEEEELRNEFKTMMAEASDLIFNHILVRARARHAAVEVWEKMVQLCARMDEGGPMHRLL